MSSGKRPLSPHLQVYKPQLTSILSITHRATGVVLAIGTLLLAWWLGALAAGPQAYALAASVLGSVLGRLILFGWTFALFYHLCNGIRHLLWDAGWGFDIPTLYKSGKIMLAAAAGLTVLAWITVFVA